MNNLSQIIATLSVLAIVICICFMAVKMPTAEDHQPILDKHHKRIDSLIIRIEDKLHKIDSLEQKIIDLSNKTKISERNYYTYKINIDELLKNYPKRNINDLDSLRSILTNIN